MNVFRQNVKNVKDLSNLLIRKLVPVSWHKLLIRKSRAHAHIMRKNRR
jgi:hypothetical protein